MQPAHSTPIERKRDNLKSRVKIALLPLEVVFVTRTVAVDASVPLAVPGSSHPEQPLGSRTR